MALHKTQSHFARAQWKLWLLVPLWILQLLLSTAMMGLFSWRLGKTLSHHKEKQDAGQKPAIEYAWEATNVGLSLVASICSLIEIVKYRTETLTPWTMLFTHSIKTTCALAILALDIVVYIILSEEYYSLLGITMDTLFLIVTSVMALHAVITHRALSSYDDYSHPANVKGYGFSDGSQVTRSSMLSINKRGSLGSARLSTGSINEPIDLEAFGRQPSYYSHERNTQFEEYMARRSFPNGRVDEERPRTSRSPASPPGTDSTFWAGTVRSTQRRPAMRATSWASDHALISVPEESAELDVHATDEVSLLTSDENEGDGIVEPRDLLDGDVALPPWRRVPEERARLDAHATDKVSLLTPDETEGDNPLPPWRRV